MTHDKEGHCGREESPLILITEFFLRGVPAWVCVCVLAWRCSHSVYCMCMCLCVCTQRSTILAHIYMLYVSYIILHCLTACSNQYLFWKQFRIVFPITIFAASAQVQGAWTNVSIKHDKLYGRLIEMRYLSRLIFHPSLPTSSWVINSEHYFPCQAGHMVAQQHRQVPNNYFFQPSALLVESS